MTVHIVVICHFLQTADDTINDIVCFQVRVLANLITFFYVLPTEGERGHTAFGADAVVICFGVIVGVAFLSALYLLNQWVDFDQTSIDTLLRRAKEVNTFGRP